VLPTQDGGGDRGVEEERKERIESLRRYPNTHNVSGEQITQEARTN
jgi:hypothetical protein